MAMTPFNLSLMGVENTIHRRRMVDTLLDADDSAALDPANSNATQHEHQPENTAARATQSTSHHRHHSRSSRHHRVTSHHNPFQTSCSVFNDPPPAYALAARTKPTSATAGCEALPEYSCSVAAEAKLLLNFESVNPLSPVGEGDWREVYIVLRGTALNFYRLKDGGAGKLLRAYTLQHAEVGLASDSEHAILVPQTRLAHLIPSAARKRAWQKDPDMFKSVKQTILRLRVETDQILLADSDEDRINSLIYAIGAAIDIAQPIDDRSIPKQCTVPRRRRRQPRPQFTGDLADPSLLAEQERIFRQMFPRFAQTIPEVRRTTSSDETPQSPAREEEEIDFSMYREEETTATAIAVRPQTSSDETSQSTMTRSITATTVISTYHEDMVYETSLSNFTTEGKWQPPHNRSPAQIQRYIKRCMPVLTADAHRASDIVINHGKRMRINWRMELLEDWELQPPSYKAHKFDKDPNNLARTNSQRSTTDQTAPRSSNSMITAEEAQVENGLENLQLSKVVSAASTPKTEPSEATLHAMANMDHKGRSPAQLAQEIHGVVFCF